SGGRIHCASSSGCAARRRRFDRCADRGVRRFHPVPPAEARRTIGTAYRTPRPHRQSISAAASRNVSVVTNEIFFGSTDGFCLLVYPSVMRGEAVVLVQRRGEVVMHPRWIQMGEGGDSSKGM